MGHSEYIRIVEGSPVAVLMVHGIVGSPCHFDDLVPLVPENWTLCNIVLDGHGGSVRDFGNTSMEKWKNQVSSWVDRLLVTHEKLLIVAHSMGTLFAIWEAVRNPERIAGLFLLAVPLRPWVTLRAWAASIKLGLGLDYSRDATAMAMRADSCVNLQPGLLRYLCWTPRFVELLREIRLTRKLLPQLTVPTLALQSERDELVSLHACRDLAENKRITVIRMPESGHFGYKGADRERVLEIFRETIRRLLQKEINHMTNRDRFLAAMDGKSVDRLPMIEWATWWDKTIARWEGEGFPKSLSWDEKFAYWGLDSHRQFWLNSCGRGCPSAPGHGLGIIEDEADYEKILPFLYQDSSIERMVAWMKENKPDHDRGDSVIWITFEGFFWFPRVLFGIEPHLYAFYDQPELMHRINRDQTAFLLKALDAVCEVMVPDFMTFAEDMSYNHGPMLSKACFDEFLAPYYKQVIPELKKRGIRVLVDTDGDVQPMIPWLAECGVEGVLPLERQAGIDVAKIRENYPDWIMLGGYDKTIMHLGEEAMRREFERLLPTMKQGRYIPAVDHQTPPDVSMEQYRMYLKLFREYAEKAAKN